jgi:hypothetical protein
LSDSHLITGQNPASSTVAVQNLINLLAAEKVAWVYTSIDAGIGSPCDRCAIGGRTARATGAGLDMEAGCGCCRLLAIEKASTSALRRNSQDC